MFLLAAVVVGALTVPLAGGRLRRVPDARLHLSWVPLAALALQGGIAAASASPSVLLRVGHVLSFALAGVFVVANRRMRGVVLLGAGGGLNGLAVAANGGVMPASPAAVAAAGLVRDVERFHNSAVVADARLGFLGDVFALPASWPLSNVFSVGDALLFVGGVLIVHGLAGTPWTRRQTGTKG